MKYFGKKESKVHLSEEVENLAQDTVVSCLGMMLNSIVF